MKFLHILSNLLQNEGHISTKIIVYSKEFVKILHLLIVIMKSFVTYSKKFVTFLILVVINSKFVFI
jgi:hypothetical protein